MSTQKITTPVGSFSKAIKGAVSLNFGISGDANCDTQCIHHPTSTAPETLQTKGCYAVLTQKLKPSLHVHLERKQRAGFAATCRAMTKEITKRLEKGADFPWIRLSSFGSVPLPHTLSDDDKLAFVELVEVLKVTGAPIHFPVESLSKAITYGEISGLLMRWSLQSEAQLTNKATKDQRVSLVAGNRSMSRDQRVAEARRLAKARKGLTGKACVVCPAIVSTFRKAKDKSIKAVKCGECKACAQNVDIIYPYH